jgi:DNA-binding NarL/FixJ family response regulator
MRDRPRLLLADNHKLVLEALRKILEPYFDVVGDVEDGTSVLDAAGRLQPDVILVDISMPLLNGIDATRKLHKICPEIKVVIVTMHADQRYIVEAFRAGASGFILKRSRPRELVDAIWTVVRGEQYVAPGLGVSLATVLNKANRGPALNGPSLTPRQREVLQLVAEGKQNKEIGALLNISLKAVEFHRSSLMHRLATKSISELTRYAIKYGLVDSGLIRK